MSVVTDVDGELATSIAAPFVGGPPLGAQEIGDGNLNMVYRVTGRTGSVIVKVAPPYLRVFGDAWPLTQDRIRIESEVLAIHGALATGRVPALLHVDVERAAMVLEDLVDHQVWRVALMAGRHVDGVAEQVGRYCARTLLGTSDLVMEPSRRRELGPRFVNPELCAVTEDLVFTAPYLDDPSNRYDETTAPLAAGLRADLPMRRAAARLLWEFRTRHEALVHGDLHTGSVMVADHDARIIDPEFAFFGPMAYDVGNLVANLGFAHLAHAEQGHQAFAAQVSAYHAELWDALTEEVHTLWPRRQPWEEIFLSTLVADSGRYAATELVRRMVGLAHVQDVESLDDAPRLRVQQRAVAAARSLALGPLAVSVDDLWSRITTEEAHT